MTAMSGRSGNTRQKSCQGASGKGVLQRIGMFHVWVFLCFGGILSATLPFRFINPENGHIKCPSQEIPARGERGFNVYLSV